MNNDCAKSLSHIVSVVYRYRNFFFPFSRSLSLRTNSSLRVCAERHPLVLHSVEWFFALMRFHPFPVACVCADWFQYGGGSDAGKVCVISGILPFREPFERWIDGFLRRAKRQRVRSWETKNESGWSRFVISISMPTIFQPALCRGFVTGKLKVARLKSAKQGINKG